MSRIRDPHTLSGILGHPITEFKRVIFNKDNYYNTFVIKRKIGFRIIDAPKENLKDMQKNILERILYRYPARKAAHGFVRKRSIYTNASIHQKNKIVFKLDISDFFPSITFNRVYGLFESMGFTDYACTNLTELITYKNRLPQGAPTSPYISNLICRRMDDRLKGVARKYGLRYSRYADDIVFSGNTINGCIITFIKKIVSEENFSVNQRKTRVMSTGTRQVVTGFVVNDGIGIGRKKYRIIRSMIFSCKKYNLGFYKDYLLGIISILKPIDLGKWKKLKDIVSSLSWNGDKRYTKSRNVLTKNRMLISIEILKIMENIEKLTGFKMIEDRAEINNLFFIPNNIHQFNTQVQLLFRIINGIELSYFKRYLKDIDTAGFLSIKIVECFIKKLGGDSNSTIDHWRNIELLSCKLFRHKKSKGDIQKFIELYEKYGINYETPNYEIFWIRILTCFKRSLENLNIVIEKNKSIPDM